MPVLTQLGVEVKPPPPPGVHLLLTSLDAIDPPLHGPARDVLRYLNRFERVFEDYVGDGPGMMETLEDFFPADEV